MENHIQTTTDHWIRPLICLLIVMSTQVHGSHMVDITLLKSAVSKGAVCLDGSPPAYFLQKGSGEGADNWLVYLEGGGWCASHDGCDQRKRTGIGSSNLRKGALYFGQILSSEKTINPDFYNWNMVSVVYCDGSSYTGNVKGNTDIKRRGARIFDAIMEDLLAKGMKNAKNAILSGGSAGGLGTILHCDGFRALLPSASRVKCISDSGFFIHAKDLPGAKKREQLFSFITAYHGITKSLPASCTSKMSPGLCLFPENIVKDIQTPFFFLESAFDDHQLKKHFFSNDPTWRSCTRNLKVCTPTQLQTMKDFRAAMIKTLRKVANSKTTGIFVHSCYRHGHFYDKEFWKHSPVLGDKTIVKAIGDWYFERSSVQEIDIQNELPQNCTKHA
ncbi:pectin acetylesterase 8-like isoform X1 [Sesamum indicum]|uniref:Pectin acetylesterase n=1 Tax=Sesamum indicum TaxID=4182 RepID=A0A6I9SU70_SESIN|nr:pectin acetylesterase 8-like isoform X1 [Sesamum indicum]